MDKWQLFCGYTNFEIPQKHPVSEKIETTVDNLADPVDNRGFWGEFLQGFPQANGSYQQPVEKLE